MTGGRNINKYRKNTMGQISAVLVYSSREEAGADALPQVPYDGAIPVLREQCKS